MASTMMRYVLLSFGIASVTAVQWPGPSPTVVNFGVAPVPPLITNAPEISRDKLIAKRDVLPNVCGWVEGFKENPYTCTGTSTCLWNPQYKVVACGVPYASETFQTRCIGYNDLSASCDASCSFNPYINRCPQSIPYCVNITVGTNPPYTAFACGSTVYSNYPVVQLTYSGQTTINYLPRFLQVDGSVSTGTQIPVGYNSNSISTTSSSPTSKTSKTSSSGSLFNPSTTASAPQVPDVNPTSSSNPSTSAAVSTTPASSSTPVGAIVGGVIGGLVGLALIGAAIAYLALRARRRRIASEQQTAEMAAAAIDNKSRIPEMQSPPQGFAGAGPGYGVAGYGTGYGGYAGPGQMGMGGEIMPAQELHSDPLSPRELPADGGMGRPRHEML